MMIFDSLIGLGGSCEVAANVRRRFGIERAGMLDWWISPFAGLVRLIEEGPSCLFDPADMDLTPDKDAAISRAFGFVFHHDFPRDSEGLVLESDAPERLCALRNKFHMLWNRMNDACQPGASVLFLRSRRDMLVSSNTPVENADSERGHADLARLCEAIRCRWPQTRAKVLFLGYDRYVHHSMAAFDTVEDMGDIMDWSGSATGWDAMFQRQAIVLTNRER